MRLGENDAYVTGVNLFSKFKVFVLGGQQRATKADFRKHLRELRDVRATNPITDKWINKLPRLSKKDILSKKGWDFVPIATTGNVERMNIIKFQAQR